MAQAAAAATTLPPQAGYTCVLVAWLVCGVSSA
jgi:hypothetical protein